ncbi:hypothetical protein Q8F55_000082 [Vanrija albida]|uniref:Amidohydrolase 3 domain-containing protein n=1 Tax=Vanrija albida TaxID=181172 RepID=A0ABR3QD74_9TREE
MPIANPDPNAPLPSPQTLFINANVVGWPPGVYAVLVQGGRVAIVSRGLVVPEPDMQVVDVRGAWIAPSLADWHTHFTSAAVHTRRLSLAAYPSAAVALKAVNVALRAPQYDECGAFVATGMGPGAWADAAILNRSTLDAMCPTKPVALYFTDGRCVANTRMLVLGGYGHDTHPHGYCSRADAAALAARVLEIADPYVVDEWVGALAARVAALGITEIVDFERGDNEGDWQRRCGPKQFCTLRVRASIWPEHLDEAIAKRHTAGAGIAGTRGLVTVGPFHVVADGTLAHMTAYCKQAYANTASRGRLNYAPDDIGALCAKATGAGLAVAVHAAGDEALRIVVDQLDASEPLRESTIEHPALVDALEVPRAAALGLAASVSPTRMVHDVPLAHALWRGREGRTWPYRSLQSARLPLRFGSGGPEVPIQPWVAMACAMSRGGYQPQECLTAAEAFAASTWNGRVHVSEGERADLILIDADPLGAGAEEMRRVGVLGTMLGGNWTHRAKELA